jgi:hypothetical protein
VKEAVLRICWDDDGVLYCGTTKGEIKRLNPRVKSEPKVIANVNDPVTGLKYYPSGHFLVCGTMHGNVYLVPTNEGEEEKNITGNVFKKAGPTLITDIGIGGSSIFILTVESTPTADRRPPDNHFFQISFNSSNQIVVKEIPMDLKGIPATCFAVSDENRWIIGYINGQIEYCNGSSDETKIEKGHRTETGNPKSMYSSNCVAISPERPFAASAGGDGNVLFINMINKRTKPWKVGKKITAMAFSYSQGGLAFAVGNDWQEGSQSYYKENTEDAIKITVKKLTSAEYA